MEIGIVLVLSVLALVVAGLLARWVLSKDEGTAEMRVVSDAIREGAEAFMSRQYRTIGILSLVVGAVIFILYAFLRPRSEADPLDPLPLSVFVTLSFFFGALCSAVAGWMGMWVSIRSNIRTASAARTSLDGALQIALRAGAVAGLFVVAMSLLGVSVLFTTLTVGFGIEAAKVPFVIVGFAFGASFVALFAQLGGGIYTKAADVGADLVGKVEAGIPEDDPRNPAVVADLVGDNVGDCAGRGADIFESTAAENIGAMLLAGVLATAATTAGIEFARGALGVILYPLLAPAIGLVASVVGVMVVRTREDQADPMQALNRGYNVTALLSAVGFVALSWWVLRSDQAPAAWWHFALCGLVGLATSWAFVWITQFYTEGAYRPVRSIVDASRTGPATNVIAGLAVGFECVALPVLTIGAALLAAYWLGGASGIPDSGIFGTAVATMGMLMPAGYIMAMDTFGPITDNAGGVVEMSEQPESVRKITDKLDAMGNTTKALTKGYAIGSAALASFLLFSAYMDEVRHFGGWQAGHAINLADPPVFVGAMLGAMLVFLFSGLAIRAVGRTAESVIEEVRRQFRERPGILQGSEKPSYRECVDIVTLSAMRQMVIPGVLAVGMPVTVGLVFRSFGKGPEAVAALLMVGTIVGVLTALLLNTSGGAWDNAKKSIESGGGKRSDQHKAAVVGDTVGDPFKDTAGPSLHVLIKLLATVTLVLAPFFLS